MTCCAAIFDQIYGWHVVCVRAGSEEKEVLVSPFPFLSPFYSPFPSLPSHPSPPLPCPALSFPIPPPSFPFQFPLLPSPPLRSRPLKSTSGVLGSTVSSPLGLETHFWHILCLGNTTVLMISSRPKKCRYTILAHTVLL